MEPMSSMLIYAALYYGIFDIGSSIIRHKQIINRLKSIENSLMSINNKLVGQ